MRDYDQKKPRGRFVAVVILTCAILSTLGCSLFSAEFWVHRLDNEGLEQTLESLPSAAADEVVAETDSNFGSKCLSSAGSTPCPIDACVVYKGQYTAKNVVTSELFGKENTNDYQCCASFQFTNNSGVDLMGFEHQVTEYGDNWSFELYPAKNSELSISCDLNYFTRNDGKEKLSLGVTEIVVLYANPHCDWIQWDEPDLVKYREPVEAGCYSN